MQTKEDKPRVVFMGTPEFAVAPLSAIFSAGIPIVSVVTVPDRPAGRGLKMRPSAVKKYALEVGLPVLQPESLEDEGFLTTLRDLKADIGVVVAFRKLPPVVYQMPRLGFFNLHASLLPNYRGAAPINWVLINGERETGVTTFLLNNEIDRGAILMQEPVPLQDDTTFGELHEILSLFGSRLVYRTIKRLWSGELKPSAQPAGDGAPVAPKIYRDTRRIDFHAPAEKIHNLVRGLSPCPCAWCEMAVDGKPPQEVKIFYTSLPSAGAEDGVGAAVGTSRPTPDGKSLCVRCGDGHILIIHELQPAGRKPMLVGDFLRGNRGADIVFS